MILKAQATKAKKDKWDGIKLKKFSAAKEAIYIMNGRDYLQFIISDKVLLSKIY
jgi:hypothetical protein